MLPVGTPAHAVVVVRRRLAGRVRVGGTGEHALLLHLLLLHLLALLIIHLLLLRTGLPAGPASVDQNQRASGARCVSMVVSVCVSVAVSMVPVVAVVIVVAAAAEQLHGRAAEVTADAKRTIARTAVEAAASVKAQAASVVSLVGVLFAACARRNGRHASPHVTATTAEACAKRRGWASTIHMELVTLKEHTTPQVRIESVSSGARGGVRPPAVLFPQVRFPSVVLCPYIFHHAFQQTAACPSDESDGAADQIIHRGGRQERANDRDVRGQTEENNNTRTRA